MTAEEKARRVMLKAALAKLSGDDRVPCASLECVEPATMRVFWPVLPGEDHPVYCDRCGAWAKTVLETMGHRAHAELLKWETREPSRRAFDDDL